MLGSRIALPNTDSTEEELNSFYSKLGRPESMDKYSVNPEDKSDIANKFRETAFKSGLTDKQAKDIYGMFDEYAKNQLKLAEENEKKVEEEFNKEFGSNIETVKNNVNDILSKYVPEGSIEVLDKLGPKSQMTILRIFDNMANKSKGEGILKGGEHAPTKDINELLKQKQEMMKSREYYNDPNFLRLRDEIDRRLLEEN
jgi:hypothetical protein